MEQQMPTTKQGLHLKEVLLSIRWDICSVVLVLPHSDCHPSRSSQSLSKKRYTSIQWFKTRSLFLHGIKNLTLSWQKFLNHGRTMLNSKCKFHNKMQHYLSKTLYFQNSLIPLLKLFKTKTTLGHFFQIITAFCGNLNHYLLLKNIL